MQFGSWVFIGITAVCWLKGNLLVQKKDKRCSTKGKVQYQPKERSLAMLSENEFWRQIVKGRYICNSFSNDPNQTSPSAHCHQNWCGQKRILKSLANLHMKGRVSMSMQDANSCLAATYCGAYVYAGRGQHRDCLIATLQLQNAYIRGTVQAQDTPDWTKSFKVAMKISTANCPEQKTDHEMLSWFRDALQELLAAKFPMPLAYFPTGLISNQPKSVLICEAKGETGTSLGNSLKEILEDNTRIATREVLVLVVRATLWAFQLQKKLVEEVGGFMQDMRLHNVLTIPEKHLSGRQGLYNVFRCVDGRGMIPIGVCKWEKLKGLHELYTSFHLDEAWKRCSTINAAIDEQWNTMMINFREDLKQLNSLGYSVVDKTGCQENRRDRSKYVALYNQYIENIYNWFRNVMGPNCGDHSIGLVDLLVWIEEEKPPVTLVPGPKTPPKAGPQNQSHGFPKTPGPPAKQMPVVPAKQTPTAPAHPYPHPGQKRKMPETTVPVNVLARQEYADLGVWSTGSAARPAQGAVPQGAVPAQGASSQAPPPPPPPPAPQTGVAVGTQEQSRAITNRWRKPDKPPSKSAVNISAQVVRRAQEKVDQAKLDVACALESYAQFARCKTSSKDTHNGITHYIILLLLKSVWHGITDFVSKHKMFEHFPNQTWLQWKRKGGRLVKNWYFMKHDLLKTELALNSAPIDWTNWLTTEEVESILMFNLNLMIPTGYQPWDPDAQKLKFHDYEKLLRWINEEAGQKLVTTVHGDKKPALQACPLDFEWDNWIQKSKGEMAELACLNFFHRMQNLQYKIKFHDREFLDDIRENGLRVRQDDSGAEDQDEGETEGEQKSPPQKSWPQNRSCQYSWSQDRWSQDKWWHRNSWSQDRWDQNHW